MLGWVRVLPMLSVALAATIPPLPQASLSLQDAVDYYNKGTQSDFLHRLVEEGSANVLTRPGSIQFKVKETECLKSEVKNIEDCKFQDGAVVKACTAFQTAEQKTDGVVINCDSPALKRTRVRRARPRNCYRRGGCYSLIGSLATDEENTEKLDWILSPDLDSGIRDFAPFENFHKEPEWIQSPDLDSGVIRSHNSDLHGKRSPHTASIGDLTKSHDSSNPDEVVRAWDEQDIIVPV